MLLVAVVALLVLWALRPWAGGGEPAAAGGGEGPAESITPGPTPSESLIDERPGGRDEASDDEDGRDDGSDGSDDGSGGGGSAGSDGANGEDASGGGSDGGGSDGGAGSQGGGGDIAPAGLPDCLPQDISLSLRSSANDYAQGQLPELRLGVHNSSDAACRLDFGVEALTVTLADVDDERIWSSADCPDNTGSIPVAVEGGATEEHRIVWDRRRSSADCEAGPGTAAAPGTYLAEAELAGFPVAQTSFRLDED
ncbi:hypothetical protein [Streptomyces avicenniae]|uniref:hypothetical protein n=1 Tax=Streptomyces avicenniae TaxID=500153 RepID=UPI00069BD1F9|nr:hypothetical protein [Streptomyces avicenniae]